MWPIELGADGVNKLDFQVYYNPKVEGLKVGSTRKGQVSENFKIVAFPGTCQILEIAVISIVLVSVVLNKIAI
ncbi:MAG: hypothetical protein EZS28_031385 [Streblomastix strix]|uniref:Uncharacterized protein n=1 Tax=Streblomastix strix TaxID=222440 RepID=A0A5J4USH5_9EUKA|nr:MAG: hypothetical protein EZS28_031385 [Streblomastix strix]